MWLWIAIGAGALLAVSVVVGLVLAAALGAIGREISELYESETWATSPPTRAAQDARAQPGAEVEPSDSRSAMRQMRIG